MALTRRYLFHGHSAALGGRIVRIGEGKQAKLIKEGFIDLPASSLTVVGGRSEARLDGKQLSGPAAQVVRFGSARAFSEGVFDDLQGHYAVTLQERSADTLTTTTKVSAEVTELEVGLAGNPRMVIKRLRGGFASQSSTASGETPVQLDPETRFDGVTFIDREGKTYTLLVDVEPQVFRDHDTLLETDVGGERYEVRQAIRPHAVPAGADRHEAADRAGPAADRWWRRAGHDHQAVALEERQSLPRCRNRCRDPPRRENPRAGNHLLRRDQRGAAVAPAHHDAGDARVAGRR